MESNTANILIVIAMFYFVVWGGLMFALHKTRHLRVKQKKSKYSPFSREMQHAVSLSHLAGDRYQWVKIKVDNSSSPRRYHATRKLEDADEQIKLARTALADDDLSASNAACEKALKLIDDAETDITS